MLNFQLNSVENIFFNYGRDASGRYDISVNIFAYISSVAEDFRNNINAEFTASNVLDALAV